MNNKRFSELEIKNGKTLLSSHIIFRDEEGHGPRIRRRMSWLFNM